jgi:hypothetical protein
MPNKLFVLPNLNPKSLRLTVLLLLSPLFFYGQSLTGLWTGALHNDSSTVRKDQSFEIALTEYKGKVYGYSRSEFIVNDTLYYIVKRVKGSIEGDVCEVTDDEIVSYNFRGRLDKGIKVTSTFRRNESDSTWYLDGNWKTNATKKYYSVTGKVNLEVEKDLTASKLFPHLEELKLADEVAFYKNRVEATPVVKVARPEKMQPAFAVKNIDQAITPATDMAIAKPVITPAVATMVEPEKEELPAVKKANAELAKTESNNIPASTGTIPTTATPAAAEIKKPVVMQTAALASSSVTDVEPTGTATVKKVVNNDEPASTSLKSKNEVTPVKANTPIAKNNTPTSVTAANEQKAIAKNNVPAATNTKQQPATTSTSSNNTAPLKNIPVASHTTTGSVASNTLPAVKKQDAAELTHEKTTAVATSLTPAVKKPAIDITQQAAVIAGRKSEFTQLVNFKSDSLQISLYDNGEIDGDTVSVFMNGEIILSKQGLKSAAIRKTIYLPAGETDEFTLVMFAESLGKYAPNTGLLVIRDGEEVYNLRFSSDFQKNAGIIFRRKK